MKKFHKRILPIFMALLLSFTSSKGALTFADDYYSSFEIDEIDDFDWASDELAGNIFLPADYEIIFAPEGTIPSSGESYEEIFENETGNYDKNLDVEHIIVGTNNELRQVITTIGTTLVYINNDINLTQTMNIQGPTASNYRHIILTASEPVNITVIAL